MSTPSWLGGSKKEADAAAPAAAEAEAAAAPAAAELAISANCVFCPDGAGIVGGVLVTLTLAARAQPHLESRHYGIKASEEG